MLGSKGFNTQANMRTKKIWQICIPVLTLIIGGALGVYVNRARMLKIINAIHVMPDNTTVRIDSTNLPIIFIKTQGNDIEREEFVTAYIKVIDNSDVNYGDTLVYTNQKVDYEGYIAIKYRGSSSYNETPNKSYAIRAIDTQKEGKKKKSKLLGMRKGKKWALKASPFDRSMIRDALTYELARPYMDFVPQTRFCEVVVDGVYRGVFSLSEQITADRLKLEKPGNGKSDVTGGYLVEIDNHHRDKALPSKHWDIVFSQEYPDSDKLSPAQTKYIYDYIDKVEESLLAGNNAVFDSHIDMLSMIDYQLASEFSHNGDAYVFSTFFYKNRDDKDPKLKFSLWDFDLGYGNYSAGDCSKTDTWVYEKQGHWWREAMKNPVYADGVKARWRQYRNERYSDEQINNIIDSLTNVLTEYGAVKRNSDAWNTFSPWKKEIKPQKYISSSYEDEIEYLKDWVNRRLKWMDKELLGEE